jgi:hypothetical protein
MAYKDQLLESVCRGMTGTRALKLQSDLFPENEDVLKLVLGLPRLRYLDLSGGLSHE